VVDFWPLVDLQEKILAPSIDLTEAEHRRVHPKKTRHYPVSFRTYNSGRIPFCAPALRLFNQR
jgi:hypothetical protein